MIDLISLLVMLVVAFVSSSITLLGETIRSALVTVAGIWALVVLTAEARDAGQRYEFGAGKLEQAGNLIVALALAMGGLWIGSLAFELAVLGKSGATPFGLALAATANAIHAMRRGAQVWARWSANGGNQSFAHRASSVAETVTLAPVLIVQATLTAAALAKDPAIAMGADCLGAIFVSLLMTVTGVRMGWEGVVDLIDHPLQRKVEEAIAQTLFEQGVHAKELLGMRSRRSGRHVFVELTLDPAEAGSFEEVRQRLARVRHGLEERLGGVDLAIRLQVPQTLPVARADRAKGSDPGISRLAASWRTRSTAHGPSGRCVPSGSGAPRPW